MAEATIVYTGVNGGSGTLNGGLFAEMKFWLALRLPTRSRFIDLIKSNGGEVVPLEQQADYKIVDHLLKKNILPDSFSYTLIEQSIRNGKWQDPEDHRAGPKVVEPRPVGAQSAAKGTRTTFTADDDRILHEWVTHHARRGGKPLGNVIYQRLGEVNNRHTWQSWRDRWVKNVGPRRPPSEYPASPANIPSSPHADQSPKKTSETLAATSPSKTAIQKPKKPLAVSRPSNKGKSRGQTEPSLSPAYQPNTPTRRLCRSEDRREDDPHSPELLRPLPTNKATTAATREGKREHSQVGEDKARGAELPNSEGPKPKRLRRSRDEDDREIPSTPEPGPPSSPPPYSTFDTANYPKTIEIDQDSEIEMVKPVAQVISQSLSQLDIGDDSPEQRTQALLRGITQYIDFNIPEPPGGWDVLPLEGAENSSASTETMHQSQRQDTQSLLQGPAQAIDFELAEPEGGWDEILLDVGLPRNTLVPVSQPPENVDQTEEQLEAWIDAHVAAGAPEKNVLYALKRSSMFTGLAELVLESLARGEGVPSNVKGIWTESEDEALKGGDGRAIKRLEEKHGKEAFQERWNFLTMYEQMGPEV